MKKVITLILLLIQALASIAIHSQDRNLREYFYTMINRPLSPRPYKTIDKSENYIIDHSELFWLAINDLIQATDGNRHWIGLYDPHSIRRPEFISDADRKFIERWYNENEFYLTYDVVKDLEDIKRHDKIFTMNSYPTYDEALSSIVRTRLIRRKASLITSNDQVAADSETVSYFNKNIATLKKLFRRCDDTDRSLVYSVALRGDQKLFVLVISVLTDGAISYDPNSCIIDRPTMYAIEDWSWINEHRIPYGIVNEILSAYYKDIICRVVLLYDDYDNFSDLLNDCEGITAVKKKIVGLHLTDIRSFLTSQP